MIVDSLAQPRRVLAARRARSNALRGRWEFPGGKVEPGESVEAALVREVQEELDVTLMLGEELMPTGNTWRLTSDIVGLRLFWAEIFVGTPAPSVDHDEVRWLDAAELSSVNWLDADRAALPAVLEELTSEPEAVSPEEITSTSEEAPPDDAAGPAAPASNDRPRLSRRWPRR
ncbi:MAG TPA: NUDIX domain-containing protein [Thermomicrobiales bacterium]|nr:NUDIX domain-containing protein [Thermomicrobiales bacterium]